MPFIQLTGLSGAGKSTLSQAVAALLEQDGYSVEIIDGDIYRKTLCRDLGFSHQDRMENIRRLGAVADSFSKQGKIAILSAINPFEQVRQELEASYDATTVWIHCDLPTLANRDTKGLYARAALPDDHPEKIFNLTGVNDVYETPSRPALVIDTAALSIDVATQSLYDFIIRRVDS